MVEAKWEAIASEINALGLGKFRVSKLQVEKKWIDLKCISKAAVIRPG